MWWFICLHVAPNLQESPFNPDDEPLHYLLKCFQLGQNFHAILIYQNFFFFSPPLCLFSPHRLTSHLWISHGLADNSWSPCHGPAVFNMNYKMASQAYQWMTDWMCMARGQRGVRAQWLLHSVNPRTGNTSVARGRVFHQHNVRHCLRQMLRWDVFLTFTTFPGRDTSMLLCSTEEHFTLTKKKKKKSPLCSLCFLERNRKKDNGEFFFFLGIHCFFLHFRHAQFLHDF